MIFLKHILTELTKINQINNGYVMQQKRLLSLIFNALWFYSDFYFYFGSTNVKTI